MEERDRIEEILERISLGGGGTPELVAAFKRLWRQRDTQWECVKGYNDSKETLDREILRILSPSG